jgi:polyphosphate kinase
MRSYDSSKAVQCYINRELSWLEFNRRVLEEAQSNHYPLLERIKFLSIYTTNLDEFFMIRVSGVRKQIASGVYEASPDGLSPEDTLHKIVETLHPQLLAHAELWLNCLKPELLSNGIQILDFDALDFDQRKYTEEYYRREIFPVLTPLAVDPGHPFPRISNLSLNLLVSFYDENRIERFARVKIPPSLPRLIPLAPQHNDKSMHVKACFVWIEQVIAANIQSLFQGVEIKQTHVFRVTRDTDIEIQWDEMSDLLSTVQSQVKDRRFGSVVRLEVADETPAHLVHILLEQLGVSSNDVYRIKGHLYLPDLMVLYKLNIPNLKDTPFYPTLPSRLSNATYNIFNVIKEGDVLLHLPYHSFAPVEDFIRTAAYDPNVLTIKLTLYRAGLSNRDEKTPIVQALIDAVNNGKQVAVMVELKARFDEENNISWAQALEEAGVHVVYGLPRIKVHAKMALVVRRENDGIRRYVHMGTGNYNASTAKIYTDLSLFTCNDDIGEDITLLFNYLTGYSRHLSPRKLLVAPLNLRQRMLELIQREIVQHHKHKNGHIIMKLNSLVDPLIISTLYTASREGVKIDLIVRGICCLCPRTSGVSDNIRVISIVGRFLEHSRIYFFKNGGKEEIYLSSADMMQRNLDRRVEVAFPILDKNLHNHIRDEILHVSLNDNVQARELQPDGSYVRLKPDADRRINSQLQLLQGGKT